MSGRLTADLVVEFAGLYVSGENGSPGSEEDELLSKGGLHGALVAQGYATREQLLKVMDWKSGARNLHHLKDSALDGEIRTITGLAFSDSAEGVRHRVLTLIPGVRRPTASAVLTVWSPDRFTVLDWRAVETLLEFGELDGVMSVGHRPDARAVVDVIAYNDYVAVCSGIVRRLNDPRVTLRSLDRALWMYSKKKWSKR